MREDKHTPGTDDVNMNEHMHDASQEEVQKVTIPDALSTEGRTLPNGNTITIIKRTKQTELIVPLRDPKSSETKSTARVILQPWATDIRKAPKHVQDDFIRGVLDGYKRFMLELEKDPVKKAEFEAGVEAMKKERKKRK